jgi:hypothetical protein
MLQLATRTGLPILASGVLTAGWADGMTVDLGMTVDPGKVGLVIRGYGGDNAYSIYGHLYLHSSQAFTVYFPSGPFLHSQRLPWALLDLSRVLRPGELVQRGRTQFNYSSTTGWTTKSVTLGTALGKYAAAYCNMLHFGRALFASAGCYINQAYPVITGATSLTFQMYEFTNGSSAAFYTSWEVWPLKD